MALQHALLPAASRAAAVGGRILSRRPSTGARPASCAATLRGFASVSRARVSRWRCVEHPFYPRPAIFPSPARADDPSAPVPSPSAQRRPVRAVARRQIRRLRRREGA